MIGSLIRLMRPGDWVKNVFVLPAAVFALPSVLQRDGQANAAAAGLGDLISATTLAVVAFCLLSSSFYAINDVVDAEKDRLHPLKSRRPVASGAVPPHVAVVFGLALIAAAAMLGFAVRMEFAIVLLIYGLVQVLYNAVLKSMMLVDVVAVASGFALRATGGAVAISVQVSIWLLLCVFFLCLYLGFIKRLCDIASAERAGSVAWRSAAGYDSRMELNWLLGVSAVLAVMTYLMYALSDHAAQLFGERALGFAVMSPLVLIAVHRFYRRASTGISDSPLSALREDGAVLVSVGLFALGTLATLYLPHVDTFFRGLFFVTHGGQ